MAEDKIAALLEEFCEKGCLIRLRHRAARRITRRVIGRHGSMLTERQRSVRSVTVTGGVTSRVTVATAL